MNTETENLNVLVDIILPSVAILISLIAVIFTAWSLYIQRKHNVKSIKPIGKIRLGDYESNIYIRIDNSGIGPLILKRVFLNGIEIPVDKMLLESIPIHKRENTKWKNFSGNYNNRTIPVGDNLELIRWTPETDFDKSPEQIELTKYNLRDTFKDWSIKIEYTDIYESESFYDEQVLTWFGRNN